MTDTGRLSGSRERSQSSLSSPVGFDPGRFQKLLESLRDSQGLPQSGRVEVDIETLCDALVSGHDALDENAALKAALEPFALAADDLDDKHDDRSSIWEAPAAMSIEAGHLRKARALTPPSEPTEK